MKNLKLLLPLATLGGSALFPIAAQAEDRTGLYIGGGAGYNRIEGEDFTGNGDEFKDSRVSYKGLAGIRMSDVFSIEGQYVNFGTAKDGDNEVKADGWTAGALVELPMFQYVHPYGKAGALFWNADGDFQGVDADDDGTDFTYGVGVRFKVTDNLDLRAEYERFEMSDTDVDMASANLQFNF